MRVKRVSNATFRNYLRKAEECYAAMEDCMMQQRWNAAVICAIHCAIDAADAVMVRQKGLRYDGDIHEDAVMLLQKLDLDTGLVSDKMKDLKSLLAVKDAAEEEEKLMTYDDAMEAKRHCERFYAWAKQAVG